MISRTHNTGVIRKRIVPIQIFKCYEEAKIHTGDILLSNDSNLISCNMNNPLSPIDLFFSSNNDNENIKIGKLITSYMNIGLASVKLDYVNNDKIINFNGFFIKAFDRIN